jgi:hypothetical protein
MTDDTVPSFVDREATDTLPQHEQMRAYLQNRSTDTDAMAYQSLSGIVIFLLSENALN